MISDLANTPIEITLGGRKLKVQRLTLSEIFTPAETKVRQEYIKDTIDIAKTLTGTDKEEFLAQRKRDTPKGKDLSVLVTEYLESPVGVASQLLILLNKCQTISEFEVSDLLMRSTETELDEIRKFATGEDVHEEMTPEKKTEMRLAEMVKPNLSQIK